MKQKKVYLYICPLVIDNIYFLRRCNTIFTSYKTKGDTVTLYTSTIQVQWSTSIKVPSLMKLKKEIVPHAHSKLGLTLAANPV